MKEHPSVIVIGGGAAGMLAAYSAVCVGARVTLVERNEKMGRKLYITGKGRCNLTNNCTCLLYTSFFAHLYPIFGSYSLVVPGDTGCGSLDLHYFSRMRPWLCS